MSRTYTKTALSFEQQLDLLMVRGLVINDRTAALKALSAISYYRLSAYWYPFRIIDAYGKRSSQLQVATTFQQVIELYEFDRKLRLLVLDALERMEVAVRTRITYHMAHTYGPFAHTDASNFHPQFDHGSWLAKLEQETSRSSDEFVRHYRCEYREFPRIPIWMVTEVMSLGALSFFYQGLRNHAKAGVEDKKAVADHFNVHYKCLGDWLHMLTYIRNVCAHHSRLWNRELAIRPVANDDKRWRAPVTPRNDRIFYVLLVLNQLLGAASSDTTWQSEVNTLLGPISVKPHFRNAMGMPENWMEHPLWI